MVSGVIIFLQALWAISIIVKACIHRYVAHQNNIPIGYRSFKVLWYFNEPVGEDYERLKKNCNFLQSVNMVLFFIIIVVNLFV